MNYSFYISGNSTRLLKLLKSGNEEITQNIKLVLSEYNISNEELLTIIKAKSIELVVIPYKSLGDNNKERNLALSNAMLLKNKEYGIDYMFSVGSHILSGDLLKEYKDRLINIHPAILPMFPGLHAIDQAEAHGNVLIVGNTAHFIDEGMDTGPIIMQSIKPLQALHNEDGTKNYDAILDMQVDMYIKLICLLEDNRIILEGRTVKIIGADYKQGIIFPIV